MFVEVKARTSVGDVTEQIECRSWHANRETGALEFYDAGNGLFRSMNSRYWLDIRELRDVEIET
jgi:hypothetical protein